MPGPRFGKSQIEDADEGEQISELIQIISSKFSQDKIDLIG